MNETQQSKHMVTKAFALFLLFLVSPASASLTVTTSNQQGPLPFTPSWTPASDSLITGLAPTTALGNFSLEAAGRNVDSLTSGGSLTIDYAPSTFTCTTNYVTCGDNNHGDNPGSNIVYTLPASANGYNLTNITVYGGWVNNGRDQQGYTVSYATAAAPSTFIALTTVSYDPGAAGGVACATRAIITDSVGGVVASNVVAVEFDFTTPVTPNHYTGYAAITVQGTVAGGLAVTTANQQGTVPFTPSWTPAAGSLIAGMSPTTALGNFSLEAAGRNVNSLTSGGSLTLDTIPPVNTTTTNYVTCGNGSGAGSNIVYTLPASPTGYNLTNITVYSGWGDNGRDAQAYTVSYATAANPGVFTVLTSVNYNPSVPSGVASANCVSIADAAGGVLVSNVVALMFDFTTPPSENGYCGYGAITVQGTQSDLTVTTANQQGSLPFTPSWTPAAGSLIAGFPPTAAGGNFNVEGSGASVNSLTVVGSLTISQVQGGGGQTCSSNYVTCGNGGGAGSNIIYTLPASWTGYNLTNITVYGGWKDGGRDQQAYTVWYASAANPNTFIPLTSVNYLPSNPGGQACSTCVTLADAAGGVLVSNAVALMFDLTTPPSENGYCGYAAITVQGAAAAPIQPTVFGISESMPVVNDNVAITSNGKGGVVTVTGPQGYNQQVTVNGTGAGTWTPPRYGQYTLTAGSYSQTVWVTVIRLNVPWYFAGSSANGYYMPTNATIVMAGTSPSWDQRGVKSVDWEGGMYYSTNNSGTNVNAIDWYNLWTSSGATNSDGIMVDEIGASDGYPYSQVCQAVSLTRSSWGSQYSLSVWAASPALNFTNGSSLLKGANALVMWEDYNYPQVLSSPYTHISYWDGARAYGLTNNSVLGLAPGSLTAPGAVNDCFAQVRLVAPEMPGLAIYNATTNVAVQAACDQAFTAFFLQPVISLQLNVLTANLMAWNIGNEDATNCSVQFLNSGGGVLQTVNLSTLQPNAKQNISIPSGAVTAVLNVPNNMVNLYANGQITIPSAAGRYIWTGTGSATNWSTAGNWSPSGPPSGTYASGNYAYFDGNITSAAIVNMPSGNMSISNVTLVAGQLAASGWTLNGNLTSQNLICYQINSGGAGQNTIDLGCQPISSSVPLTCWADSQNLLLLNGQVSGSGGVVKTGPGAVTMLAAYQNSYTGATVVSNGLFDINGSWALNHDFCKSSSYSVAAGATLQLDDNQGYSLRWQSNGPAITGSGTFLRTGNTYLYFANEPTGKYVTFNQSAGGLADFEGGTSVQMETASGNLGGLTINNATVGTVGNVYFDALAGNGTFQDDGAGGTLNIGMNGGSGTFSGSIADGNSAQSLLKQGAGTEIFTGFNSYTGSTTVEGGTLDLSQGELYSNSGFPFVTTTIENGATVVVGGWSDGDAYGLGQVNFVSRDLVVNGGTIRYVATSASGNMDRSLTIGAQGATLDASGNTVPWTLLQAGRQSLGYGLVASTAGGLLALTGTSTLANNLNYNLGGTGGLTKSGGGTWTVSGANTYTGATTVSNGTLFVSGSIGSGAVTVAGGTLGGMGTIGGSVTVNSSGTLAVGTANLDALTINNTLTLGGNVIFNISKTGGVRTQNQVRGLSSMTFGGTLTVTNITSDTNALAVGDSFQLFNAASYAGHFTVFNLPAPGSGLAWSWMATNGTLTVVSHTASPILSGGVSLGGGQFQLTFSGSIGQDYKVLASTNVALPLASWTWVTSGTFNGSPVTYTDTKATNKAQFYRVVSP
jgi:autotransporter-associated beta strand protein